MNNRDWKQHLINLSEVNPPIFPFTTICGRNACFLLNGQYFFPQSICFTPLGIKRKLFMSLDKKNTWKICSVHVSLRHKSIRLRFYWLCTVFFKRQVDQNITNPKISSQLLLTVWFPVNWRSFNYMHLVLQREMLQIKISVVLGLRGNVVSSDLICVSPPF